MSIASERAVRGLLTLPAGVAELVIVIGSVAMSVAFTATSLAMGAPTPAMRHWSLWIAVIVPTVVAGPIGALLMHLLRELDQARTEAQRLSLEDAVTGLPNRRHWLGMAERAFVDTGRSTGSLIVMLLDIDDFKRINDRFGHAAGDTVLAAVGKICERSLRAGDFAARWGGEEFVILMRGSSMEAALQVADRLRVAIADQATHHDADGVRHALGVTVSVGVADVGSSKVESALRRADEAMYRAKAMGKNRCLQAT